MELVVGASEATMKSLLGKLGNLLAQEYALISGVRGDIQYINDELASMQAFLRDLSTVPEGHSHDHRMKDWMKQIRDIAYDVEDCIDDFAHRLPQDSISAAKCSFLLTKIYELWTWWPRRDIASNIAELKARAQQIADRRNRYGVNNPEHGDSSNSTRTHVAAYDIAEYQVTSPQIIGTKEPVGMTDVMDQLEGWLTSPQAEKGRAVLSIVGFGGVGKTTIATALYSKVSGKFQCRASVSVSQNYDQDTVLRSILNQVSNQEQGSSITFSDKKTPTSGTKSTLKTALSLLGRYCICQPGNNGSPDKTQMTPETMDYQLLQELKKRLNEKSYILLIDDIWSAKTWESIIAFLPENNKASKIIVTSRFQAVGSTCSASGTDRLHTVGYLTDNESKKLFKTSLFESRIRKDSKKVDEQLPEEIWKICGGLPLAIVTMAGLVACNPSKPDCDWRKLSKSLFPETVTSLTLEGVKRILDCCYNDLTADLKTCLLYLSIFPKGCKISRKRLTRRWIAEGFASEKQGLIEDGVAETYFNQLTIRNLIRPVEHGSNGKVKTFQVHDMVLEYIMSKSIEENFITVVGGHWQMTAPSNKVRRLSMQTSGSKQGSSTKGLNLAQVRSLTVFGNLNHVPFHSFNYGIIQILDLEGWKGLNERHMTEICQMLVLKYLSIRRTEVAKIPSKIQKLEYLETLDIRETYVEELPKSVGQLKRISSILGGNKKTQKGLRFPQEKSKKQVINPSSQGNTKEPAKKGFLSQEKGKGAMNALRVLTGIEIVEEPSAVAAGLHQLTGLKKLAIYKLNISKDSDTFRELHSSIEYLGSCGLQTLAINDENSDFINSLDELSAPPRYLVALELSGKLKKLPQWIKRITTLNKLTISVTVLRTETFKTLHTLHSLFSLTFALSAVKQDQDIIKDIIEDNKLESDGEIVVPGGGFKSLKLLRFFAPFVPKLSFSDKNAMPALEIIEMQFKDFEGLFGIEILENLREVHLKVGNGAEEITKFLVNDLKNNTEKPKVFVDGIVTA
uniref:NLR-type disease resistance protein n=1 Tax=Oryza brachyantha TaxID=4533 RepID=A0A8F5R4A4_ORYBR|nr:NLR-type disease resistance protein [Oryza brachyantha]QXN65410.1 NLR-type disease resistance protein [Oryza brachyantha]QXN65411.1 NLR-type disease resistance protein [Oryza brachyantha]